MIARPLSGHLNEQDNVSFMCQYMPPTFRLFIFIFKSGEGFRLFSAVLTISNVEPLNKGAQPLVLL